MPEVSVVIPTFKRPGLLIKCLKHLDNQSLLKHEYEVLVISDGPDEITAETVRQYAATSQMDLVFMSTPGKQGPAVARNLGWHAASSPLIAFTDDDCEPDVHWLENFLEAFREKAGLKNYIPGSAEYLNKAMNVQIAFTGFTKVPVNSRPTDFEQNTHGLQFADFITANCAVSVSAMQVTGGFDERFGTAWREDSDLEFNLLNHAVHILRVREAVVVHPVRKAPWGISIKEQRKGLYDALLYKKHPDFYRKRLSPGIIIDFYFIVMVAIICLLALISGWWYIAAVTFSVTFIMIFTFFLHRIRKTSKAIPHIIEMWVTSMVIPFLSVYWRIYGAVKFRVLFL